MFWTFWNLEVFGSEVAVLAETLSYENYRGFPHVQNQRHNRQTYQPIECNVNQEQHIQSFNEFDLFWLNLSNECNLISVQYIWHLIQFDGMCVYSCSMGSVVLFAAFDTNLIQIDFNLFGIVTIPIANSSHSQAWHVLPMYFLVKKVELLID